eukprot:2394019-Alexandrium_andersonii.AAC.2
MREERATGASQVRRECDRAIGHGSLALLGGWAIDHLAGLDPEREVGASGPRWRRLRSRDSLRAHAEPDRIIDVPAAQ